MNATCSPCLAGDITNVCRVWAASGNNVSVGQHSGVCGLYMVCGPTVWRVPVRKIAIGSLFFFLLWSLVFGIWLLGHPWHVGVSEKSEPSFGLCRLPSGFIIICKIMTITEPMSDISAPAPRTDDVLTGNS